MTNVKTCTKCNQTKATTEFSKDKGRKDGLESRCKCCASAASAAWDNANKAQRVARNAAWNKANKAHKNAYQAEWQKANPERVAAYSAKWQKANPDHRAALYGKTHAVARSPLGHGCIPEDFDIHATIPIYAESRKLSSETGELHHVDHIISLTAGGLHVASNLQVLTAQENMAKGAA